MTTTPDQPPLDFESGGDVDASMPKPKPFCMQAIVVEISEKDKRFASVYGGKSQAIVAFIMFLAPKAKPEDQEGDIKEVFDHQTFDVAHFVGLDCMERAQEYAKSFLTTPVYTSADVPTRVMLQKEFAKP